MTTSSEVEAMLDIIHTISSEAEAILDNIDQIEAEVYIVKSILAGIPKAKGCCIYPTKILNPPITTRQNYPI